MLSCIIQPQHVPPSLQTSEVSSLTQQVTSLSSTTSGLQEEAAAGGRLDVHYTRLARWVGGGVH